MGNLSRNYERAQELASSYIENGISPETALNEFSVALEDAKAVPQITKALHAIEAGERGIGTSELRERLHKRINDKYHV